MAKEKFVKAKPHVNVGTIGHVATVRQQLQQLSQKYLIKNMVQVNLLTMQISIKLQKKEQEV